MTDHTTTNDETSVNDDISASDDGTPDDGTTDDGTGDGATDQRTTVRERYGSIATDEGSCCGTETDDGCAGSTSEDGDQSTDATDVTSDPSRALAHGYDGDDLADAPDGSNLGLGCGNPVAISNLEDGETVLDLGSGGGFDCFLAAQEVGSEGRVIGVDMTPEMLERARGNADESDHENVEFRLGEIEHLPVADGTVDTIISNCVVNLSPEKPQVLREAFRVLQPGGTLAISDLVATGPLPPEIRDDPDAISACVGGAATVDDLETWLDEAGFVDVSITNESEWADDLPIVSARIEARKPA